MRRGRWMKTKSWYWRTAQSVYNKDIEDNFAEKSIWRLLDRIGNAEGWLCWKCFDYWWFDTLSLNTSAYIDEKQVNLQIIIWYHQAIGRDSRSRDSKRSEILRNSSTEVPYMIVIQRSSETCPKSAFWFKIKSIKCHFSLLHSRVVFILMLRIWVNIRLERIFF